MPQISIGPKFFIKERDNLYRDWETAFSREYNQNSIDAGARNIWWTITPRSGGGSIIKIADDGCGMTREVLEKVFFSLGETTKEDGVIGGFGRARILTCFSMESYVIRTGNLIVRGAGSNYEIEAVEDSNRWVTGCEFVVDVGNKTADEMREALFKVLRKSEIAANVYVNGEQFTNWMKTYTLARTLDCGIIYTNKSQPSNNEIVVRVKGLWMFDIYTNHKTQVVVEVDPANSRKILTANRDGMHRDYNTNLTDWVGSLAVDRKSALRETKIDVKIVKGFGFIVSKCEKEDKSQAPDADVYVAEATKIAAKMTAGSYQRQDSELEQLRFGQRIPGVYIACNTTNKDILSVKDNYDPENWTEAVKKVRGKEIPYRKGSNYMKLLVAWRAACEEAVDGLLRYRDMSVLRWLVGWTFDDTSLAEHTSISLDYENGSALLLNPVTGDGTMRYNLTDRLHLMALMSLAKHEVSHVVVSAHSEDFSTLHTAIDARYDSARALRAMKSAIAAV